MRLFLICAACTALSNVACVKLPRRARAEMVSAAATPASPTLSLATAKKPLPSHLVDLNRAAPEELAQLPGVGAGLAARICEHRARYGSFRRVEHLLMVRGISERRFARVRPYVTVE